MSYRISDHPVLQFSQDKKWVSFNFNGQELKGIEGEPILVALRANGVVKLREGAKHHTPFGPFCLQGRCCSCNMTVDGRPNTMTCVTPLIEGVQIEYQGQEEDSEAYRRLPDKEITFDKQQTPQEHPEYELAIIGAGPAGIEAALAAAKAGCQSIILFDDKSYLGGQLVLQTHAFFGNEELGAGVRGFEIAHQLEKELEKVKGLTLKLGSTVIGYYPHNVLAFKDQGDLNFARAKKVIVATGASERFLAFKGNSLPGVMGAGGAQTMMNIYGVRPGKRVLIVGGGNIGVILAYQLLQAKVEVVAVIEGGPKMGAYAVHVNKVKALGTPILTRHTIVEATGKDQVESATIAEVDAHFKVIPGTEKQLLVDTICLAVGLHPLNELLWQAGIDFDFISELGEVPRFDKFRQTSHPDIFVAGDCAVIGEASIARLEGRLAGLKASYDLGYRSSTFTEDCDHALNLLHNIQSGTFGRRLEQGKNKVTQTPPTVNEEIPLQKFNQSFHIDEIKGKEKKIIIRCDQDIPCNPCEASCHLKAIRIGASLTQQPDVDYDICKGCGLCLPKCPGRAIQVLQYNYNDKLSAVTIPYEFDPYPEVGQIVEVLNREGHRLTLGEVIQVKPAKERNKECGTITFTVPHDYALNAVAIHVAHQKQTTPFSTFADRLSRESMHEECCSFQTESKRDESYATYVCRCEEVSLGEIEDLMKEGYHSLHEIKRLKRVGMGACQGLSCSTIMQRLLQQENLSPKELLHQKLERRSLFRPPSKKITLGEAARMSLTEKELREWHLWEQERTLPMELVSDWRQHSYTSLSSTSKRKIAIIGGGIGGVMTAWWLSQMGESDVVVIESDFLAAGKTGACLGGIRTGFNTTNKILRAQKGLETYRDAEQLIGQEVGWHQGGYVYLAFDEKQDQLFQLSAKEWETAKIPFTYTQNKNEFIKYVPGLNREGVYSLVYFPEAGGANPFKATFHFAKDAEKKGVQFLTHHEVVEIQTKASASSEITGIVIFDKHRQAYHKIECEHVINSAGTSANKVSKMVGIDISSQVWIESHGALVTEKIPQFLDALIVSYHPSLSGYWQQKHMEKGIKEGELVACYSPNPVIKGFNKAASLPFLTRMSQSILHCCPNLEDVGILRSFAEHYVGRTSGIPIIGPTAVKGFWMNVAKKGHGFMCAPGDSWALAQSILSGKRHEWISECTVEEQTHLKETMK